MEILGLVDVSATWVLVAGLLLLIYLYGKKRNRVFKDLGIPGPEPTIYIGNLFQMVKEEVTFEPSKYGEVHGAFLGGIPMLCITNTDMIKEILIKQFSNFTDRLLLNLDDYPIDEGMFFKTGDVWRRLRRISSPTFSGSKLRIMSDKIASCCEKLTDNFLKASSDKSEILVKEYFGSFTMDVIASTAFGIDTDSQNEMHGKLITEVSKVFGEASSLTSLKGAIPLLFPEIAPLFKKLGFSTFPKKSVKFIAETVSQMINQRREEPDKVKRVDFLQLLIDAEDDGGEDSEAHPETVDNKHMTTEEVLGQALLFFVAGYETTGSTLHYAAYLLATNPEVQERAAEEIDSVLGDSPPNYDNIKQLVYLDHVITETQRMFPVVVVVQRTALETVKIGDYNIPKGMAVLIPAIALHRDPKHYPDPHKFMPERWERKTESDPMNYLPFGAGPRQCIGMRLAKVEMMFALASVLKKVKFLPATDTPMTLEGKDMEVRASLLTKKPIRLRTEAR